MNDSGFKIYMVLFFNKNKLDNKTNDKLGNKLVKKIKNKKPKDEIKYDNTLMITLKYSEIVRRNNLQYQVNV